MKLRPAQFTAVKTIWQHSKLLLADVGAGKTATACCAIRNRCTFYGKKRVLVLGTKRICNMVWGEEIKIWTPEFSYASVAGQPMHERCAIIEDPTIDIVGLNYDNLIWAVDTFGPKLAEMFPLLVIDESSKLENPASKSFQAIKSLLPAFEWRLPMTGTPRANHLYDLWGNAYLADLGEALGQYRQAFLQKWFWPVKRAVGVDWLPKHNAEQEINERLAQCVHRMPFEHQAPVEIDVLLPLNPVVKAINDEIDEALANNFIDVCVNGITYTHNANRIAEKQLQLSSGLIYNDRQETVHLHDDKLVALWEIVTEAKGEPVMVVYRFIHELDAILKHFPQARLLDNDKTLAEWNQGQIEMLLVHPLSCGHGLNAQFSGCNLMVWFTPTTDAELYTQTIGRLNRPGNLKTVRVLRLIMQGTKDKASYMVVAARQRGENATLEMFA